MPTQRTNHVTMSLTGRKEDLPYLLPYQTSRYIGWAAAGFAAGIIAAAILVATVCESNKGEHHDGKIPTTSRVEK